MKNIKEGSGDAMRQDPMLVYEIETEQGMMHVSSDWLEVDQASFKIEQLL